MRNSATVIVVTARGGDRLRRLLASLRAQTMAHQLVLVDNASMDGTRAAARDYATDGDVIAFDRNIGFGRAVNAAAARADGDVLVLVNDDCVCDPQFVERIASAVDSVAGVAMAAGVLRDAHRPELIDSAGMELDSTLLVFDYLNGLPVEAANYAPDPVGPSGAAAAFDAEAFRAARGFDEHLFAYWEDVDLVLRLRAEGATCALARGARGTHEHAGTLGAGSRDKNYLMGFGRGYVLRKWSVPSARRLPRIAARDVPVCAGQALLDRNVAGAVGRVHGYRAARAVQRQPYPRAVVTEAAGPGATRTLYRRARRRANLRARKGAA